MEKATCKINEIELYILPKELNDSVACDYEDMGLINDKSGKTYAFTGRQNNEISFDFYIVNTADLNCVDVFNDIDKLTYPVSNAYPPTVKFEFGNDIYYCKITSLRKTSVKKDYNGLTTVIKCTIVLRENYTGETSTYNKTTVEQKGRSSLYVYEETFYRKLAYEYGNENLANIIMDYNENVEMDCFFIKKNQYVLIPQFSEYENLIYDNIIKKVPWRQ